MKDIYKRYFLEILKKYRLGSTTPEENTFLEKYYNLFEVNEDLVPLETQDEYNELKDTIKIKVDQQIDHTASKSKFRTTGTHWLQYAAAASILVLLSVTLFLLNQGPAKHTFAAKASLILPGSNKAILTLANGKRITLDDAASGEIAQQAGFTITKTADGQIIYTTIPGKGQSANQTNSNAQNTISTPKGGQYQVILPDGTRVWLNAASSLSYPALFTGKERLVSLSGEAYFEVSKNKEMPFRVRSGAQTVEVLGTHFNINAYPDEASLRTTLLEGSVKVSSGTNTSLIAPGQQAMVSRSDDGNILTKRINTEKEIAWKNGVFSFENDDVRSIMRQIARWYDLDVVYTGNLSDEKYKGEIPRNSNLAEVIQILELNNVHFDLEGKTIKVSSAPSNINTTKPKTN